MAARQADFYSKRVAVAGAADAHQLIRGVESLASSGRCEFVTVFTELYFPRNYSGPAKAASREYSIHV
jgi:hypothetical protein